MKTPFDVDCNRPALATLPACPASPSLPVSARREFCKRAGLAVVLPTALAGCWGEDETPLPDYGAAIAEGRRAVEEEMASSGATAVGVAFFTRDGVVWAEAQGEREAGIPLDRTTLFAVASGSKMLVTVATLMLVERGQLALDRPLTTWLGNSWFDPALEPRYAAITPRMLMNHTSGLPGNDARDAASGTPFTGYAAQVLAGLRYQRLKHKPGELAAYNNDGFTLLECLVAAVSGVDYRSFVRRELLDPLGMTRSRYQDSDLPPGSFVRAYLKSERLVPFVNNVYGSGGLYSTPEEFARFASMLLSGGSLEGRRYLSPETIAATGIDQTLGTFNPVPCEAYRYGLGWDTMAQPGLADVGVRGWQKTGDAGPFTGTNHLILPDEGLGVVVFGASEQWSSDNAVRVCERILLQALVERGRLSGMPAALSKADRPVVAVPAGDRGDLPGYFASSSNVFYLSFDTADRLTLRQQQEDGSYTPAYANLKLRNDGWYAADGNPVTALRLVRAEGRLYLALRQNLGSGHYASPAMLAERLERRAALSAPWNTALGGAQWVPVNVNSSPSGSIFDAVLPYELSSLGPRADAPEGGLPDYLRGVSGNVLRDLTPPSPTRVDGCYLRLPTAGRDVAEASLELQRGEAWLRSGSFLLRPVATIPALDPTQPVVIGAEGWNEWFRVPRAGSLTTSGASAWQVFDGNAVALASGLGDAGALAVRAGSLLLLKARSGAGIKLQFA